MKADESAPRISPQERARHVCRIAWARTWMCNGEPVFPDGEVASEFEAAEAAARARVIERAFEVLDREERKLAEKAKENDWPPACQWALSNARAAFRALASQSEPTTEGGDSHEPTRSREAVHAVAGDASAQTRTEMEIERRWCLALLPEGPDVIARVTGRVIKMRDDCPEGHDFCGGGWCINCGALEPTDGRGENDAASGRHGSPAHDTEAPARQDRDSGRREKSLEGRPTGPSRNTPSISDYDLQFLSDSPVGQKTASHYLPILVRALLDARAEIARLRAVPTDATKLTSTERLEIALESAKSEIVALSPRVALAEEIMRELDNTFSGRDAEGAPAGDGSYWLGHGLALRVWFWLHPEKGIDHVSPGF